LLLAYNLPKLNQIFKKITETLDFSFEVYQCGPISTLEEGNRQVQEAVLKNEVFSFETRLCSKISVRKK
jgi:hypothetical protein